MKTKKIQTNEGWVHFSDLPQNISPYLCHTHHCAWFIYLALIYVKYKSILKVLWICISAFTVINFPKRKVAAAQTLQKCSQNVKVTFT